MMAIGGVPVSCRMVQKVGQVKADYQIHSRLFRCRDRTISEKHVYLFGFLSKNQPKVLVTQQNQGNPDNYPLL